MLSSLSPFWIKGRFLVDSVQLTVVRTDFAFIKLYV